MMNQVGKWLVTYKCGFFDLGDCGETSGEAPSTADAQAPYFRVLRWYVADKGFTAEGFRTLGANLRTIPIDSEKR
jgi:hypothetical protein